MSDTVAQLLALARESGERLAAGHHTLACAESCTAGGVAFALTQIPGSSSWFDRGYVVYSNEAKQELLGVPVHLLQEFGAVSEPVARAMAVGALRGKADVALAVTGIAGPEGGTADKPVGTVCFAWALRLSGGASPHVVTETRHLPGDRAAVRTQSIVVALQGLGRTLRTN